MPRRKSRAINNGDPARIPSRRDISAEEECCAVCDKGGSGSWVQCDVCQVWYHQQCVGISVPASVKKLEFTCFICLVKDSGNKTRVRKLLRNPIDEKDKERVEPSKQSGNGETGMISTAFEKIMSMLERLVVGEDNRNPTQPIHLESHNTINTNQQKQIETHEKEKESQNDQFGIPVITSTAKRTKEKASVLTDGYTSPEDDFYSVVDEFKQQRKQNDEVGVSSRVNSRRNSLSGGSVRSVQTIIPNPHCNEGSGMDTLIKMMKRQQLSELPKFAGDEEMWPVFWEQYNSSTQLREFTDVENLQRLRKCLEGDALKLVQGKLMLPNCLEGVMSDLQERYGRSENVVKRIVRKLRSLPPPDMGKPSSIMEFRCEISNGFATLRSMNAKAYLESPTVVDDIVDRLLLVFKRKWRTYVHGRLMLEVGQAKLENFVPWFLEETHWAVFEDAAHKGNKSAPNSTTHVKQQKSDKKGTQHRANVHQENPLENVKCVICKAENHNTVTECPVFKEWTVGKRWAAAKNNYLCFSCLHKKHRNECPERKECGKDSCKKFHHVLLHSPGSDSLVKSQSVVHATVKLSKGNSTYYRILPVKVHGKDKVINVNVFFDEGSSLTMMTQDLADQLQITGVLEPLCISWTDENSTKLIEESYRVSVRISGVDKDDNIYDLRNVRTVPTSDLDLPKPTISVTKLKQLCGYLEDLNINQPFDKKPQILIGLQHSKLGLARNIREGSWNMPVATKTLLGWVVYGPQVMVPATGNIHRRLTICECQLRDEGMETAISKYFSTEYFGVRAFKKSQESLEEERAKSILESTTVNVGRRYETGLLWRSDNVVLPDSRPMAMRRLLCLERQMLKHPEIDAAMKKKIQELVEKGYASKLSPKQAKVHNDRTWYLPIFPVRNPHKPEKIRVVYDAAAKVEGQSLNSNLMTGPDMLTSLIGVLWRAREGVVAISGDIREMFHQVIIRDKDKDSQRFLWRNGDQTRQPDTYVLNVMTFGASCSPCSAQYVKNTNAQRFKETHPRAVKAIIENHYVDDYIDSYKSESEAQKTALDVSHIHAEAGFHIRNWLSNCERIMQELNGNSTPESQEVALNLEKDGLDKILGLYWDIKKDVYTFRLNFVKVDEKIVKQERIPTKREVLKVVMAVFDPHGYLSPILVHAKILLQNIWRREIDWDQNIPDDLNRQWCSWLDNLRTVEKVQIPRCYSSAIPEAKSIQLHTFVDASEEAFAAVCYIRIVDELGNIEVRMIGSKNKVAPKKQLSIPRLELQAAVLGARWADTVVKEHRVKFEAKYFWSDSQTVLAWIRSDHRSYKQFVAIRISEILDTTHIKQWRWVPGKKNVADIATKTQPSLNLSSEGPWFSGPSFLRQEEGKWPQQSQAEKIDNCEEEIRTNRVGFMRSEEQVYSVIEANRFSNWKRLVRAVGWIVRVKNLMKTQVRRETRKPKTIGDVVELSADEIQEAERILFWKIQHETYFEELKQLKNGKPLDKNSKLKKLSPVMDESTGLLRLRGRIDNTPLLDDEFKKPIILDRNHYITKLMVDCYHRKFHHQNNETVINEIRQRFWISEARQVLKTVVKCCQMCKNAKTVPEVPEMAALPAERLAIHEHPFTCVGMDYFGPLLTTCGRRREKRYGVVFTCLTTRAVHLELANSLDTNSCIMAVKNFVNRRGPPKIILSDNGTNLHGAENELKRAIEEINRNELTSQDYMKLPGDRKIEWKFITPRAPHMGGAWERMVRSTKNILYACLKERAPKEEVLRCFLVEAENILNSRPLTCLPLDPETKEAITPNHLLRMKGQVVYQQGDFEKAEFSPRKSWKYSQQLADEFWRRFVHEYLPTIARRTKWHEDGRPVRLGDVVVICDEAAPRNLWEKGIITEVHPGSDGKVRSVTVKTYRGIRKRPVSKIAVLDVL